MPNSIKNNNKHSEKTKYIVKISILSALAAVIMLLEFPLWFAPPFYEIDFSEIPILIGAFSMGPLAGVLMEFLKNVLNLLMTGTTTAFVGELANFITGCAFILPAAIVYKYKKTFLGAIIGMIAGILSLTLIGSLLNYFFIIPAFSKLYKLPIESIISMGAEKNNLINDLKTFVALAVAPFNLFKGTVCSLLVLPIYKRVSKILSK